MGVGSQRCKRVLKNDPCIVKMTKGWRLGDGKSDGILSLGINFLAENLPSGNGQHLTT